MCIPAHVAGMVKGVLIECTERGFSKQWEDCMLAHSEEEEMQVLCKS